MHLDDFLAHWQTEIGSLDWDDLTGVETRCRSAITWLLDEQRLCTALELLKTSPMIEHCEHKRHQDKFVLCRLANGASMRVHLYLPGHAEKPEYVHDHRWAFYTTVVRGRYFHTLYDAFAGKLRPILRHWVGVGDGYLLLPDALHTVTAEPYTITILIRGPTVKAVATLSRADTGRTFSHFGHSTGRAQTNEVPMTSAYLDSQVNKLRSLLTTRNESNAAPRP
jgi:hypothetical protein